MNYRYSTAAGHLGSSAVRNILKLTQGKDILSLAGGLPAEDLFPLEAVRTAYDSVFTSDRGVLQYGLTEGYGPLREQIAGRLCRQGLPVSADELLLTTGSQQAIDLICRMLIDPGDTVLVESPTYLAALQVLGSYRANIVAVDGDEHGMLPDDLARKLALHRPKLLYTVPTFGNPTGLSWSTERRLAVIEACRRHGTPILEDNPYGELSFAPNGQLPPCSLASIAHSLGCGDNVIYTGTFSKIVAPALRTGWIAADRSLIDTLAKAKQAADLHSSTVDQRALSALLDSFDLAGHIAHVSREYARRMTRLSGELAARRWQGASWREPEGGMFLWLELAPDVETARLLPLAIEQGVAFVPGEVFYPAEPRKNTMRLNFTHTPPEQVALAVERLERAIADYGALAGAPL